MSQTQEVKVPELGESITEAIIATWLRAKGEYVRADEPIVELETDKITVEVPERRHARAEHIPPT